MNKDLKNIKKYYGEEMMHLARELFATILEHNGLLFSLISREFAYNKYLYDDLINYNIVDQFKNYIYSLIDVENKKIRTKKTPYELLDEAGYTLYECKSEEDIEKFKKYYAKDEELCTFKGGRLDKCYVFFAVKKNVDEIKREDFKNPMREDLYGTSVISIQFSKDKNNYLSIKNRYNHHVINPDATFHNNLDNIIPGLTESFEVYYNLHVCEQVVDFNIDEYNYIRANDGKYYKFNYEIDGVYYCLNNILIDNGKVITTYEDKSRYIFIDSSILDLSKKRFILYNNHYDGISFIDTIPYLDKIDIQNINENKKIIIKYDDAEIIIILDKFGRIIEYKNDVVKHIGSNFLSLNTVITDISLDNVLTIDDNFLFFNKSLKNIKVSKLEKIGNNFLKRNRSLTEIILPSVKEIESDFISENEIINKIYAPNLAYVQNRFLFENKNLTEISFPCLIEIGKSFLCHNNNVIIIDLANLREIGSFCLQNSNSIEYLNLPSVKYIGDNFFEKNKTLKKASFPKLVAVGHNFFKENEDMIYIYAPKLDCINSKFFHSNPNMYNQLITQVSNIEETPGYQFLKKMQ